MTYKYLNSESLEQQMFSDLTIVKQFVALYIQQTPIDFALLSEAVDSGDYEKIRSQAHHIKPTMVYIGALSLKEHFQEMETLAKDRAPMENIQQEYIFLKTAIARLMEELTSYEKSLP